MKNLVVAAHPDDEVLGCGGLIAKSDDVSVVILGDNPRLDVSPEFVLERLGVKKVCHYNYPDNQFDTVPLLNMAQDIERVINKVKPEVVYTHSPADLNIDHRRTFEATMAAVRPMTGGCVKKVYCYEVPSATEWAFGKLGEFKPNTFVDINETLHKKIAAMAAYESEAREFPHPRSGEALIALAQWRGATVGLRAAEAFELVYERC